VGPPVKSSFVRFDWWNEFVNADEIAYGLSPLNQASMAIEAGRLMLKRTQTLIEKHKSFAFETTGAANLHIRTLQRCRDNGYQTGLLFLYLSSPELAIERVKLRVSQGGHHIPETDIVRRYYKGIKMLFSNYIALADNIELYDNMAIALELS
jgi:predicted ABC-type ATPase